MHNKWSIGLAASAMLLAGSAFAQQGSSSAKTNMNSQLTSADRTFIQEVSRDNLAEVKTAKMVEQKTQDPAIRDFAKDLVKDHAQAEQQLSSVADAVHVTLPRGPNAKQTNTYDNLKKMSGRQLDTAFLKAQLQDHKADIQKFDQELKNSQDPSVKSYTAMVLPHLQDHIRIAEDLAGNMNMNGKAGLNNPTEAVSAQALHQGSENQSAETQNPRQ
jgi:putative membrane protein